MSQEQDASNARIQGRHAMKSLNQNQWTLAVLQALSSTLLLVLSLFLTQYFYELADPRSDQSKVQLGPEVLKALSPELQTMLNEHKALFLEDELANRRLLPEEQLIRIAVVKKPLTPEQLNALLEKNVNFYWKEISPNRDYCILYIGKWAANANPGDFVNIQQLKSLFRGGRFIVEKVILDGWPNLAFSGWIQ